MSKALGRYRLDLLGPFGLFDHSGARIEITSKRARALIAMLATGRDGTRTRAALQDMLWGSRTPNQAQTSLRRELSNLRPLLNRDPTDPLLTTAHGRVQLNLRRIEVDFLSLTSTAGPSGRHIVPAGTFLEGIDLVEEEGFEDWLRDLRNVAEGYQDSDDLDPPAALPARRISPVPAVGLTGPSITVLAATDIVGEPSFETETADAVAGLTDLMASVRWLPVMSNPVGLASGSPDDASVMMDTVIASRYLAQIGIRRDGDRLMLVGTLASGTDRRLLWTRRFPLIRQDDLGPQLVALAGGISSHIETEEMRRAISLDDRALQPSDLVWRARWHNAQYTAQHSRTAEALLDRVLADTPHAAEALIQLAFCRQRDVWGSRGATEQISELRRLAQRAIAADGRDGRGYLIAGIAEIWLKNSSTAIALLNEAIALNPALAYAHAQLGAAHYLNSAPDQALPALKEALRIDIGEHYTFYVEGEIAMTRAMQEDWDRAIEAADRSIMRRNAYWFAHVAKIHALVGSGDLDGASGALRALSIAKPSFEPDFIDWVPFVDARWPTRLKSSLVQASGARFKAARLRA